MDHLVQPAVTTIRERFWEPLTLDDLAQSAMVSKYHFLRVFSRVTGVTPGRFLSAVRLQEAKRLLLSTTLTVADISARVGYSSSGSFTRRFTESVGLSPTQYRRLSLTARTPQPAPPRPAPATRPTAAVTGILRTTGAHVPAVYVGAFDGAILQGVPACWSSTRAPGRFTLDHVPTGTWHIHAVAPHGPDRTLLTATAGPVRVDSSGGPPLDITLSPMDWTRPPILSALSGIDPQQQAA
ncbi:helix-turn-helix transcriptional regulator [Streptomyces sp. NPDC006610]|uniref:helix-turn-helix transcriptional regulator n=1 Tax=Streptomyces sp. NPDC006610 TaxID=3154584 RepID=UPI0033B47E93